MYLPARPARLTLMTEAYVTDLTEARARVAARSTHHRTNLAMALPVGSAAALPTGTVTFLLTDIVESTPLWESGREVMAAAVSRHYAVLDEVVSRHGGVRPVEQGEGDSMVAVFTRASDAAAAAVDAQRALLAEAWPTQDPLTVRMAVHTGD